MLPWPAHGPSGAAAPHWHCDANAGRPILFTPLAAAIAMPSDQSPGHRTGPPSRDWGAVWGWTRSAEESRFQDPAAQSESAAGVRVAALTAAYMPASAATGQDARQDRRLGPPRGEFAAGLPAHAAQPAQWTQIPQQLRPGPGPEQWQLRMGLDYPGDMSGRRL
jgi:hypothetical protein